MNISFLFVKLLLIMTGTNGILLHSDADIAREMVLLRQEMAQLKAQVDNIPMNQGITFVVYQVIRTYCIFFFNTQRIKHSQFGSKYE